ncbi:MAG: hypothetical protein ACRDEA_18565 [Microcystaceae cyanobacterium]
MELVSLTAGAIATLILTKALEKTGEVLGEKALEQSGKLMQLLWQKFPKTAQTIESIDLPALEGDEVYLDAEIVKEIDAAVQADAEVAVTVQSLAQTVTQQVMAKNFKVKGNLEAGNLTQKAKFGIPTHQSMLEDAEVGGDVKLGDLTQEG